MQSSFKQICAFNMRIGNSNGNPEEIDWELLSREADMIQSEVDELREAIAAKDTSGVRDALCDIHIFTYGTHYKMGYNADEDMYEVIQALYSRFCNSMEDVNDTIEYYARRGIINISIHGTEPYFYLKSELDYPDAPKGKFLKSKYYKEPTLE